MSDHPVLGSGALVSPQVQEFSFRPLALPVPLTTSRGERRLLFRLAIRYVINEHSRGHAVRETRYWYQLLDADGREILAYRWRPTVVSPVTWPHLHLSGRLAPLDVGRGESPLALGSKHLSTGPITLADMVRLLITEFDVRPRRDDWADVLAANHDPFAPED